MPRVILWYPPVSLSETPLALVTSLPPPLLGYNNNVQYQGRVFHIQTEDSGVRYGRVVTHLFADGGRIVRSVRSDYADVVGKPEMAETVKQLMKAQHRAMAQALRSGELDDVIERIPGLPPRVFTTPVPLSDPILNPSLFPGPASSTRPLAEPQGPAPEPPSRALLPHPPSKAAGALASVEAAGGLASVEAAGERAASPSLTPNPRRTAARPRKARSIPVQRTPKPAAVSPTPRAEAGRRPSLLGSHRPKSSSVPDSSSAPSLFHDGSIEDQTLDEVILSYLREDLDER